MMNLLHNQNRSNQFFVQLANTLHVVLLTLALIATILSINLHHLTTAGGAARLSGYLDSSLANSVLHFRNTSHIQSTIRINPDIMAGATTQASQAMA